MENISSNQQEVSSIQGNYRRYTLKRSMQVGLEWVSLEVSIQDGCRDFPSLRNELIQEIASASAQLGVGN